MNFIKPTKGKLVAFSFLLLLATYAWMPAPYSGNINQSLGLLGTVLANISIILFSPVIFLYGIFLKYKLLFFILTLVYNYIIICVVAKIFQKYKSNLPLFFSIFILLEIAGYIIGSFFTWHAMCSPCILGDVCSPCPSGNYGASLLFISIIPNLILAFIFSYIIKKYKLKKQNNLVS
jgi:hypothetical protein